MFFLTLPSDAPAEGECNINGEPCRYRLNLDDGTLAYRRTPADEWDVRRILQSSPSDDLTLYICSDADGSDDFDIITPGVAI